MIIGLFLFFFLQCNKAYAYEYYSYSKEDLCKMTPITVTPGYAREWDMSKFSNSQNNNVQNNNNYNKGSSGSTYFIYSQNKNPSYCIPGSTYIICH